jgi:hypothetical protein
MTANELANLLEHGAYPTGTREQAATMLRQQADRIADLEARLDERADEVMSLENQIGMMTGYGHN